jgi:hypothetical protein
VLSANSRFRVLYRGTPTHVKKTKKKGIKKEGKTEGL